MRRTRYKYTWKYWDEMELIINKILEKKVVDEEAFLLRDRLEELIRLEVRNILDSNSV